jgi:hypothetical protein
MSMVIVAVVAHCPAEGVNVYVVVVVVLLAGDQLPEILLLEVRGRSGMLVPAQYGPACVKLGVTGAVMAMVIVAVVAHCPSDGVKVYVVVVVVLIAGDQTPEILLLEVRGRLGMLVPAQYGPACVKLGVTGAVMAMVIVAVVAHCPAEGVKVYVVVVVLLLAGDQLPEMLLFEVRGRSGMLVPAQYGPP